MVLFSIKKVKVSYSVRFMMVFKMNLVYAVKWLVPKIAKNATDFV